MKRALFVLCVSIIAFAGCSEKEPSPLGVTNGKLSPCPESPNCVASQSDDKKHFIAPFSYEGSLAEARESLAALIKSMRRARIVTFKDDYIHAEFASRIFRFVDDVELFLDDKTKTIHLRSASRVGYWDLGINRKRMETIRALFEKKQSEEE